MMFDLSDRGQVAIALRRRLDVDLLSQQLSATPFCHVVMATTDLGSATSLIQDRGAQAFILDANYPKEPIAASGSCDSRTPGVPTAASPRRLLQSASGSVRRHDSGRLLLERDPLCRDAGYPGTTIEVQPSGAQHDEWADPVGAAHRNRPPHCRRAFGSRTGGHAPAFRRTIGQRVCQFHAVGREHDRESQVSHDAKTRRPSLHRRHAPGHSGRPDQCLIGFKPLLSFREPALSPSKGPPRNLALHQNVGQ